MNIIDDLQNDEPRRRIFNVELRMLWNWNFFYLKKNIFMVILYTTYDS